MRIIYDARVLDSPLSGLGRFCGDLLLSLLESRLRLEVRVHVLAPAEHLCVGNRYIELLRRHAAQGRCVIEHVPIPAISLEQQWAVPSYLRKHGGDLYFYPHFDVPSLVPIPFVFVVHDLTPLKVPEYMLRLRALKRAYFRTCIRRGLRGARRCIVVSKTTRRDILEHFGTTWSDKIHVSYEGSSLDANCVDDSLRPALGVTGPYLLYVGTRRPNKNIRYMLDVFAAMRRRGYAGELVMAGSTTNFGFDADAYAAQVGSVRMLGAVTDAQLASLYAGMDALLFVSKYEGFGLPVIEAAKFGRPMIVSDGGAIAEIAPSSACVIPLTTDAASAGARAVDYLRTADAVRLTPGVDEMFSWHTVARSIFPEAY